MKYIRAKEGVCTKCQKQNLTITTESIDGEMCNCNPLMELAWQRCPLCYGEGRIPTLSTNMFAVCSVCKGQKIIHALTGLPPSLSNINSSRESEEEINWSIVQETVYNIVRKKGDYDPFLVDRELAILITNAFKSLNK